MHTPVNLTPSCTPRHRCLSALAIAAALGTPGAGWAQSSTISPQTQLWTELDLFAPLSINFSITGIGQLRVSDEPPNPALTSLGMDVNYKFGGPAWPF